MMKLKVLTVVGTRPEIIRLSRILHSFDKCFDHVVVHTNQNYDKNLKDVFFRQLKIRKPKYDLKIKEKNAINTISKILIEIEKIILIEKPDAFFILGDTNSSLSAIVAKKYQIPIFHYEAGNRCFDERVPEEVNRKIVDHISDINLTYSSFAKENLLNEGRKSDRVIKIGSPLFEVLDYYSNQINSNKIISALKLEHNNYFLISFHREENVDNSIRLKKFLNIVNILATKYKKRIIISTHPRTQKKLDKLKFKINKLVTFSKPFGYFEYVKLQQSALIVISDSGSISEEASILSLKAISLRDTQERQEAMTNATIVMSILNKKDFFNSINILLKDNYKIQVLDDYKQKDISLKLPRIIQSYYSFIKREVWKINL